MFQMRMLIRSCLNFLLLKYRVRRLAFTFTYLDPDQKLKHVVGGGMFPTPITRIACREHVDVKN
jgi:hypothetical protein